MKLRLEGLSYGEIRDIFRIPKSTLSGWFSGLEISKEAQEILNLKTKHGFNKLTEFNKTRTEKIKIENENIGKEFESQIGELNIRELKILGAALYWGEGYKNFTFTKRHSYPYICLANSDPQVIIAFIYFMGKALNISRNRIKTQVMIYPGLNPGECVKYWQELTKIPIENFRYQVALSKASQGKRPKHLLPHGTLQLRINRRQDFFKIKGLIDGIIGALEK